MTTFIKNHSLQDEINESLKERKLAFKTKLEGGTTVGQYSIDKRLDMIDEEISNLQAKYNDLLLEKEDAIEKIKMIDEYLKAQDDLKN